MRREPGSLTAEILPEHLHGFSSEERLRLVLSAVHVGVWEVEFGSGRSSWSREMYEIFGCDPASPPVLGSEFVERFVHPDDRKRVAALLSTIFSDSVRTHYDHEYRAVRADGSVIWISAVRHVRRGDAGQPIFMMGIHRDITARKDAELARMEKTEFIQRMAAVAPDPVYVFDLDEQRPIYGNRALTEQLGYGRLSPTENTRTARSILHPGDQEATEAFRRTVLNLRDHEVAEIQSRYRHADGTWRWILVRNSVFARKPDGRVYQIVGASVDITEQKAVEEELRRLNTELEQRVAARTAELTAANHELEAFVHSVSHDLRAPLRSIDGFSKLLLADYREQIDDQAHQYLSRIIASTAKLHELMDSLLALSKASRGPLTPTTVDLAELANTIAVELQRRDPVRAVRFVIAHNLSVTADEALMRIALENLFENAWKFTRERSQARIEFGVKGDDEDLAYFVKDNGVGFDMVHAEKVFAPFERLHDENQFPGTGIGLATVQRIITRHGGPHMGRECARLRCHFFLHFGKERGRIGIGQAHFLIHIVRSADGNAVANR